MSGLRSELTDLAASFEEKAEKMLGTAARCPGREDRGWYSGQSRALKTAAGEIRKLLLAVEQ